MSPFRRPPMMTVDEVVDRDDEVGCWVDEEGDEHHGDACLHPTCTDCGTVLEFMDDDCPSCGRKEAG